MIIDQTLSPGHFFVAGGTKVFCDHHSVEEIPWELFRGRLLDSAQTRATKTFESWNLHLGAEKQPEPILSVKWDAAEGRIHVVRAILCHVWEAYEAEAGVILSRETTRWVRELVGNVHLKEMEHDDLRGELSCLVFQAVVGVSRLPLTSLEAPLPGFSLGEFAFLGATSSDKPLRSYREMIPAWADILDPRQSAKLLEFLLRTLRREDIADAARLFIENCRRHERAAPQLAAQFRAMFNEVSLSPYTNFVDNTLDFLQCLVNEEYLMLENQVDFLSHILRQLGRHLTAYDLITFHHRGANYPDALLLDAVLKKYLRLIEECPDLFAGETGGRRRRALRQALLLRHFYEGHLVPDAPTSPGENARVLPPPHIRVPEEQLLQTTKRTRPLYAGEPTIGLLGHATRGTFQQSLEDLKHADELRELGTAIFIDRRLGIAKLVGEPDQTPLLSHEAFSRSIAGRRLGELALLAREAGLEMPEGMTDLLRDLPLKGLSVREVRPPDRPIVALADALRVADDFLLLRTLPGSVHEFFKLFDAEPLAALGLDFLHIKSLLIVPSQPRGVLAVFDDQLRRRAEIEVLVDAGFKVRRGVELPAAGLRARRLWRENGDDGLRGEPVVLRPRWPEKGC